MALNCSGLKNLPEPSSNRNADNKTKSCCRICLTGDNLPTVLWDHSSDDKLSYLEMLNQCVPDHKIEILGTGATICSDCVHLIESSFRLRRICLRKVEEPETLPFCVEIKIEVENDLDEVSIIDRTEQNDDITDDMKTEKVREKPKHRKRKVDKEKEAKRKAVCKICGKLMQCNFALEQHIRRHTGERPFICEVCGKSFRTHGIITKHMQVHSAIKSFHCYQCSFQTTFAGYLRSHMMRIHDRERPFQCPQCKSKWNCKSNLKKHIDQVHGDFNQKCDFCDAAYKTPGLLRRHIVCHYRERQYECPICKKLYAGRTGLVRHMKKKHPGTKWPSGRDALRAQL